MAKTRYTARLQQRELIEYGIDNLLECPVYRNDLLVLPTSGSISIYNATGTAIVSGGSITFPDSVASYTLTSGTIAGQALSEGWRIEWTLVVGGFTYVFRNQASLVKYRLYPVITGLDIAARMRALDVDEPGVLTSRANHQSAIDEADIKIQAELQKLGNRPWLVANPADLREAWLTRAIAIEFSSLSAQNSQLLEVAREWNELANRAFDDTKIMLDWDQDGAAEDSGTTRPARSGGTWLC